MVLLPLGPAATLYTRGVQRARVRSHDSQIPSVASSRRFFLDCCSASTRLATS